MGLLKRMSNLVSANLNDLIDQCEDPEKMLRQAVRDMETALGQLMDGGARAIAHHKMLARKLADQKDAISRRTKLAEAAVARGNDDAARSELRMKIDHQRLADALTQQVASADALGVRLRRQVTAMRIKLAEAKRKLVDITARNRAAAAQRKFVANFPRDFVAVHSPSNFDAICTRVEQSEAETEALIDLLGEGDTTAQCDVEIEAELRALKEAASNVTC
jgi:phage shock protein A